MKTLTNSLILTNLQSSLLEDPSSVVELIAKRNFNVELVALRKFQRIIIVCPSPAVASALRDFLLESLRPCPRISFSIKDNHLRLLEDDLWALQSEAIDFLELPLDEGSRRFLILPPLSPQNEWNDYGKSEDGPNTKSVYSPADLSHLLWDRLGGFDSSHVRRFADDDDSDESDQESSVFDISTKPEVLFEDIDNGVPAIVVDKVKNRGGKAPPLPRTTIPPPL